MADPKATPINALPNGQQQGNGEDEQFIKNILNQMNEDNAESEQAYNQTQQTYQQQQFAVNQQQQHAMNQQQIAQQQQQQEMQYEQDEGNYEEQYEEAPQLTLVDKVKVAVKLPLLFMVFYFVLCLPFVRTFVANQVSRFSQSASVQLYGTSLLLGLIGGVIFYLVNRFAL